MKYWYNHKSGKLHGFPDHIEHELFLKQTEHAPKLGVSKEEAARWQVDRTKGSMMSGRRAPLFVYSREPYDAAMQDKVFKNNTRINVTAKGDTLHSNLNDRVNWINVHTHSLKEYPHAQEAVMKIIDKHGFDPDETFVNHETHQHGQNDIATTVPSREYMTTNSGAKMWSRNKWEDVDIVMARILEGDDVDRALMESAAVLYHYFYGNSVQKELAR